MNGGRKDDYTRAGETKLSGLEICDLRTSLRRRGGWTGDRGDDWAGDFTFSFLVFAEEIEKNYHQKFQDRPRSSKALFSPNYNPYPNLTKKKTLPKP